LTNFKKKNVTTQKSRFFLEFLDTEHKYFPNEKYLRPCQFEKSLHPNVQLDQKIPK
jgi:hypothetical protein